MKKPHELWVEDYNEELLKKCCELYITINDLLFSILLLSYSRIREAISMIVKGWMKNSGIKLGIMEKFLIR